jgi:hypothetical protein
MDPYDPLEAASLRPTADEALNDLRSALRAQAVNDLVEAQAPKDELELYHLMLQKLRALKAPCPAGRLSAYEEAVAHIAGLRCGLTLPFTDVYPYHMARNARPLVPGEPALLHVRRIVGEAAPVRYLFCLEIDTLLEAGRYPRPRMHYSRVELSEWNIRLRALQAFMPAQP